MAAPSRVNAEAVGSRETVAAGEVGGEHFRPPASDLRLGPWPSEGMAQGRAGAALTHGGSRHTVDRVAQEHKDTRPRSQGQTEVIGYRLSAISLCSSLPSCRLSSRLLDFSTSRLLVLIPPMPHPAAPCGLGHSTSARHPKDVAEAADERRAPRAQPDGDSPPDRSRVILAPSDRGAPQPVAPARRRSVAVPARSPGQDAARRARSPWPTADDLLFHCDRWLDPGSIWSDLSGKNHDAAPRAETPLAPATVAVSFPLPPYRAAVSAPPMARAPAPRSSAAAPHVHGKLGVT